MNDFTDYTEKKAEGICEIIKDSSDNCVMTRKKWNAETGELDNPEVSLIDVEALKEKKAKLLEDAKKEADSLDIVIKEVETLQTSTEPVIREA